MNPPASKADLEFAEAVIREAGEFTLSHFGSMELQIITKSDGSPVTVADHGAETLIRERIAEAFPDDGIHGEEHDDVAGTSGRRWIIDPIDGTQAFTRGVPTYSNLLYLEDEFGPSIGVINLPALGELVAAGRGLGCLFNDLPCSVSTETTLDRAVMSCSGFDFWDPDMLMRVRESGMAMRTWGDGYGYVLVATGRIEAMVDPVVQFWDVAPCQVIIPEAGGTVTTVSGDPNLALGSAVATNGLLHADVRSVIAGNSVTR